jgi:hypothetical protein
MRRYPFFSSRLLATTTPNLTKWWSDSRPRSGPKKRARTSCTTSPTYPRARPALRGHALPRTSGTPSTSAARATTDNSWGRGRAVDSRARYTGYIEASAWGQCVDERPEAQAPQSAWGRKALEHTRTSGWQERTPTARVVGMHARTERDAFHPMEVAATAAEVAEVRAWGRPLLVWPEERRRPIRLMHALPLVWYAACHLNAL